MGGSYETSKGAHPKITLYTNHNCPYAHRAHIALKELDLPYEEVIIDLEKPREDWYLKVNPRGLVPSIKFSNGVLDDEIITESGIVTQFLADIRPSHLLPASMSSPTAPLERARIAFFADTWNTKVSSHMMTVLKAEGEEKEKAVDAWFGAVEKEIEPLLKDAKPFFGGSEQMTMAEVQVAPFLVRMYAMAHGGLVPKTLEDRLNGLPNFSKWAKAVMAKESVTYVFDEATNIKKTTARIEKMKAQAKV